MVRHCRCYVCGAILTKPSLAHPAQVRRLELKVQPLGLHIETALVSEAPNGTGRRVGDWKSEWVEGNGQDTASVLLLGGWSGWSWTLGKPFFGCRWHTCSTTWAAPSPERLSEPFQESLLRGFQPQVFPLPKWNPKTKAILSPHWCAQTCCSFPFILKLS